MLSKSHLQQQMLMVRCAVDIIQTHGPIVRLSIFSQMLYDFNQSFRRAAKVGGGMLSWLRDFPQIFELHGVTKGTAPGHEGVSLRGSSKRPPTQAALQATAGTSAGAGPSGLKLLHLQQTLGTESRDEVLEHLTALVCLLARGEAPPAMAPFRWRTLSTTW